MSKNNIKTFIYMVGEDQPFMVFHDILYDPPEKINLDYMCVDPETRNKYQGYHTVHSIHDEIKYGGIARIERQIYLI